MSTHTPSPEKLSEKVARLFPESNFLVVDSPPSSTGSPKTPPGSVIASAATDPCKRESSALTPGALMSDRFLGLDLGTPTKKTRALTSPYRKSVVGRNGTSPTRTSKAKSPAKPATPVRASRASTRSPRRQPTYSGSGISKKPETPTIIRQSPRRSTRSPIKSYAATPTSPEESEGRTEWKAKVARDKSKWVSPFGYEAQQACDACQMRAGGESDVTAWGCGLCATVRGKKGGFGQ